MKQLKFIFIISLILFISPSCNKYEEGPLISFRSVEKRLIGIYDFNKCSINGIESLYLVSNDSIRNGTVDIQETSSTLLFHFYYQRDNLPGSAVFVCNRTLKGNDTELLVGYISSSLEPFPLPENFQILSPILDQYVCTLSIEKLTNKELIIETEFNNETYRYEFTKWEK